MKRLILLIVSLILLITPQAAQASIDVNISGNGTGSKSIVSVENNVDSSTTTTQKSTSKTDIRIENNGEVKEFHGEGNVNVKLGSGDANNSVSIINNDSEELENDEEDSSESALVSAEFDSDENFDQPFNLVEFIKQQLSSIFKLFGN